MKRSNQQQGIIIRKGVRASNKAQSKIAIAEAEVRQVLQQKQKQQHRDGDDDETSRRKEIMREYWEHERDHHDLEHRFHRMIKELIMEHPGMMVPYHRQFFVTIGDMVDFSTRRPGKDLSMLVSRREFEECIDFILIECDNSDQAIRVYCIQEKDVKIKHDLGSIEREIDKRKISCNTFHIERNEWDDDDDEGRMWDDVKDFIEDHPRAVVGAIDEMNRTYHGLIADGQWLQCEVDVMAEKYAKRSKKDDEEEK